MSDDDWDEGTVSSGVQNMNLGGGGGDGWGSESTGDNNGGGRIGKAEIFNLIKYLF